MLGGAPVFFGGGRQAAKIFSDLTFFHIHKHNDVT